MASERVLFVLDRFYLPDAFGGIESATHDMCKALSSRGVTAAVATGLSTKGTAYFKNRLQAKLLGRPVPADRIGGHRVYRSWNLLRDIDAIIDAFKPTIIVCQQVGRFLALAEKAEERGLPVIVYLRDNEWQFSAEEAEQLARYSVAAVTHYTAHQLRERHGIDAAVIPSLVLRTPVRARSRGQNVTMIGVHEKKGTDRALDMAERLPGVPFLFVQSWNQADPGLLQRIHSLKNAQFLEPTRHVKRIYRQTRILLAPSRWLEAWCRVITEAQINGIPVIASDRGGLANTVGDGGILLPLEAGPEKWAETLKHLYYDDTDYRALSDKARARTEKPDVDPEALTEAFLDLCRKARSS